MIEEKAPLIRYALKRTTQDNKNLIGVFCGPTGSGKSYGILRLAEVLDNKFNMTRCEFKALDFIRMINQLIKNDLIYPGMVVIWDELGAEHSAREFMTLTNRVVNYFFQTCRHYNMILLMTVPVLTFIDSNTRKVLHFIGEMQGVETSKGISKVKIKIVQTNVITGKSYMKFLRYQLNGRRFVSKKITLKLPSKELIHQYEIDKSAYTKESYVDYQHRLEIQEQTRRIRGRGTDVQKSRANTYNKLIEDGKNHVDAIKIMAKEENVGYGSILKTIRGAESLGLIKP